VGFDSLPGGEQDDELFSGEEGSVDEVEFYKNKETAKGFVRTGRLRDAWNRCGTWTIYVAWGVAVLILASFFGGLVIAPFLPAERVNTELIFKIFDWVWRTSKESFLVISAYFFGRKHKFVSSIFHAITSDD